MQYASTLPLSFENFGLPQKSPCGVIRFSPEPSGWMTYRSTSCRCSQRPRPNGSELPRSDENAIQRPSGDHDGLKSPPGPDVSAFARRVCRSIVHKSAVPAARVETNTSCLPSGENAAWSSYAVLVVSRSRPVPSGFTRKRSADPSRSDVKTIEAPSGAHTAS
jgi:hypothetical protein